MNITDRKQTIEETIRNLRTMADEGVQGFFLAFQDHTGVAASRVCEKDMPSLTVREALTSEI